MQVCVEDYINNVDVLLVNWLKITETYTFIGDFQSALASLERYEGNDKNYISNPSYYICAIE